MIAQAAGRDIYSGPALIRHYGRLTVLAGLAAIIGPVLGGQLATFTDWRGLFLFLAGIGVVILTAGLLMFRETLPPDRRTRGGLRRTGKDFRSLLADRTFLGAVLVQGFVNAAIFAYLAGATFVLQGVYGLSPQEYALAFGLNSAGFMVFAFISGSTAMRWSLQGTVVTGLAMSLLGAAGLLAAAVGQLPLAAVVLSLLLMVSGAAVVAPPITALALAEYPQIAGTASSLLGTARYAFGAAAAPLVGIAGAGTMLPLGVVTVVSMVLAFAAYLALVRPGARGRPRPAPRDSRLSG